jgi:hypothetical protein
MVHAGVDPAVHTIMRVWIAHHEGATIKSALEYAIIKALQ